MKYYFINLCFVSRQWLYTYVAADDRSIKVNMLTQLLFLLLKVPTRNIFRMAMSPKKVWRSHEGSHCHELTVTTSAIYAHVTLSSSLIRYKI